MFRTSVAQTAGTLVLLVACNGGSDGLLTLDDLWSGELTPYPGHGTVARPVVDVPEPPAAVDLGCPEGWFELAELTAPAVCHPWPSIEPQDCGPWGAHYVGADGCMTVGATCPADGFPAPEEIPALATVIYVEAGASGDGSRGAPLGTLTEALMNAAPGTVVAIAAGTYDEDVTVGPGVTLLGACAEQTALVGSPTPEGDAVVTVAGADVEIRNLRLADTTVTAIRVPAGSAALVSGVVIEGAQLGAAQITGGSLVWRDSIVRGAQVVDENQHRTVLATDGASLDVARLVFADNQGDAITALHEGTRAVVRDTHIARASAFMVTRPDGRTDTERGLGIIASDGAQAEVRSFVGDDNDRAALYAGQASTVLIEDVLLRRGQDKGIWASMGGACTVRRARIEESRRVGLRADTGGDIVAEDVLVRDTLSVADTARHGRGIEIMEQSAAEVFRAQVERSGAAGVRVSAQSTLRLEDAIIRDSDGEEGTGEQGYGLVSELDSMLQASRVLIERSRTAGLIAGPTGVASLEDIVVRDTRGRRELGTSGHGLHVAFGSEVVLTRAVLEGNRESGVSVYGAESSTTLSHVVVSSTRGRDLDGAYGAGITISSSELVADHVIVEDNPYVGVHATRGATVMLEDTAVLDTAGQGCEEALGGCEGKLFGIGVGAYLSSHVETATFAVDHSLLCGVQIAEQGNLVLSTGVVSRSLIGACVQVDGYDMGTLTDSVTYQNNVRNLQAASLQVPEAAPPIVPGA